VIPVRLNLVVSAPHVAGHLTIALAVALAPTVSATTARSIQPVLGTVRSFVHSACTASLIRPSGVAHRWPRPARPRPRRTAQRTRATVTVGSTSGTARKRCRFGHNAARQPAG